MDSASRQMLEIVRKRKANLEKMEQLIIEEFGEPATGAAAAPSNGVRKRQPVKVQAVNGTPRKVQLHEWLKSHGPTTRSEIIKNSGLPEGTISGYLSTEKDLFESRDGIWHAR